MRDDGGLIPSTLNYGTRLASPFLPREPVSIRVDRQTNCNGSN